MKKSKVLLYVLAGIFAGILIILISAFIGVIFSKNIANIVGELLGTGINDGKKETLQFLGWITGGLAGPFFGLLFFNRRAAAQDENNRLTAKGHDQDRRKAAVEHLSNKESSVRIASFYEFCSLAKDTPDYAKSILGILCAHLRRTKNTNDPEQELTESQALIDILFSLEANTIFGKLDYDLRRTHLPKVNFREMHKPKGKVNFSAADLSEAVFDKVDLSRFNFRKARLCNVKFRQTDLQNSVLADADLSGAKLSSAKLADADFRGANLSKAKLFRADLSNTDFRKADLHGVDFCETNLSKAKISKAKYDNRTRFPKEFDRQSDHGMKYCFSDDDDDDKK